MGKMVEGFRYLFQGRERGLMLEEAVQGLREVGEGRGTVVVSESSRFL